MKLDLNKPWIRKLVERHSVADGCSFIRGILLHYLGVAILVTGSAMCCAIVLAGLPPLLFNFFGIEAFGPARIIELVGDQWATFIGVAAAIDLILLALLSLIASLVILDRVCQVIKRSSSVSSCFPKPMTQAASLVKESIYAAYHKICPRLEFTLPDKLNELVVGKRIRRIPIEDDDYDCFGTPIKADEQFGVIHNINIASRGMYVGILWDGYTYVSHIEVHWDDVEWFFKRYELDPVEERKSPV